MHVGLRNEACGLLVAMAYGLRCHNVKRLAPGCIVGAAPLIPSLYFTPRRSAA